MNKLEERFINASKKIFSFLETDYGFARHNAVEEGTNINDHRVSVLYMKPGIFIKIIFKRGVSIAIGVVENGKPAADPDSRRTETLSKAFTLHDLVAFRTQSNTTVLDTLGEVTLESIEKNLSVIARALQTHGTDVMKGDLTILEDLAIINKNQAGQNRP
jgi:hypothetical protein